VSALPVPCPHLLDDPLSLPENVQHPPGKCWLFSDLVRDSVLP
jgi:hypothetical protein